MDKLINRLLLTIEDVEDKKTLELFEKFKSLNSRGYLNKQELIEILRWKSPRPLRYYEANSEREVNEITALAFATESEQLKIHILTALIGVNYPSASAILMFYDSTKYAVIDIRVWQQLYKANLVSTNPRGQNFTAKQWITYLTIIRRLAIDLGITTRQVEKRLFDYDRKSRLGNLYANAKQS